MRALIARCGWVGGLAVVLTNLLTTPAIRVNLPLMDATAAAEWLAHADADQIAYELLKLGTVLWVAWLLIATVAALLLMSAGRYAEAARLARKLPSGLRTLVRPSATAMLAASLVLTTSSISGATEVVVQTTELTLTHLGADDVDGDAPPVEPVVDPDPNEPADIAGALPAATMTHLGSTAQLTTDQQVVTLPEPMIDVAESTQPATWIVVRGDHFWSVADAVASTQAGRPVSNAEVGRYWLTLIDANRTSLPDPSNPDLIYPGMRLLLPPFLPSD